MAAKLLGHDLGHFLSVFDQNCRVYIGKSEAIGFLTLTDRAPIPTIKDRLLHSIFCFLNMN